MLETLRQPKWLIAASVVMALAAVFVRLGFWQLDRLEQRQSANTTASERLLAEPQVLSAWPGESDPPTLEYRHVVVSGVFDPSEEILIRSQTHLGSAGFHVVTPLVTETGWAVLVNRGWVPLALDEPPVAEASPPPGVVRVEGWVHLTQTRPPLGPEDPPGELAVFNRVDVARIQEQVSSEIAPFYVVEMKADTGELPIPVGIPDVEDDGPHLAYAIQWFSFAIIGVVGYYFLLRRRGVSRDSPRD